MIISVNSNDVLIMDLVDISGRVIISSQLNNGNNQIDLSNYSAGTYFVNIKILKARSLILSASKKDKEEISFF
ncbi:MAG: T9SS type A sorting domain-containing protein [Crocinitomicaceae bacterium]|nr:T9SS type A sorting domain-containing protein [Crocinitomicaceae bacterium]